MTSSRVEPALVLRPGGVERGERLCTVEAPVAIEVDGLGYAVMMMTPADLPAFAIGFMLTERLADDAADVADVDVFEGEAGWIVRVTLAARCAGRIHDRVRHRTSDTSCGLCGIAGLEQLRRPVAGRPPAPLASRAALFAALAALRDWQPLNAATGAVHAAAACDAQGHVLAACEDVGRHNALDKLVGTLAFGPGKIDRHPRAGGGPGAMRSEGVAQPFITATGATGPRPAPGWAQLSDLTADTDFILVTSRLSFEMVDKALVAGVAMLVGVSAPTTLAIDHAREHGLTLVGLARGDAMLAMCDPWGVFQ